MEKRTLFALILSFLVIFIWQNLFMKKVPVKVGSAEVTEEKEPQKEEVMEEKAPETVRAEEHVFENQGNLIRFSNIGGRIKEWLIKEERGIVNIIHEESPMPEDIEIQGIDGIKNRVFSLKSGPEEGGDVVYELETGKGIMIRKKICISVAPSTRPASSSSLGIASMDCRNRKIPKTVTMPGMISPRWLSISPKR